MPLAAVLTVGWPDVSPGDPCSANVMHKSCEASEVSSEQGYGDKLLRILQDLSQETIGTQSITIKNTENLFRRRVGGFTHIKKFAGKLNEVLTFTKDLGDVECEIDVFAYAFLKGAKNFDFFLPETKEKKGLFRAIYPQWRKEITGLESFERDGRPSTGTDISAYLKLRCVVSRKSARDERRALATLLVSGPSTREDVTEDLSLPYSLAERILPTLQDVGVVDICNEKYIIKTDALPRVVFCLREVMGLDLLPVLAREE